MMLVDVSKYNIKSMIFQKEEYIKFIKNKGVSSGKMPNEIVAAAMARKWIMQNNMVKIYLTKLLCRKK